MSTCGGQVAGFREYLKQREQLTGQLDRLEKEKMALLAEQTKLQVQDRSVGQPTRMTLLFGKTNLDLV